MQEFKNQILIRESHLDTFGHVNNATYLQIYEEVRWDIITGNGFGMDQIKSSRLGPVILDLNLKFKREIRNRETITVKTKFRDLKKNLIMKLDQEMINEKGELASRLELTVGLMDMKQRKLVKPTLEWLKAIGAQEWYSE